MNVCVAGPLKYSVGCLIYLITDLFCLNGWGGCIVMLFVLITIMLGFSFIQYTNTWLSHEAFFITRDIDI